MQLTRFSDYSLRVLMYLAAEPERLGRIEEIAETYAISHGHVKKVVRDLGLHGFVDGARGRGGGIRLSRAASEIVLGDVIRKTEENLNIVACFEDSAACLIEPACGLRTALEEALDAFLKTLDKYTLADLVQNKRRLTTLLQIH